MVRLRVAPAFDDMVTGSVKRKGAVRMSLAAARVGGAATAPRWCRLIGVERQG